MHANEPDQEFGGPCKGSSPVPAWPYFHFRRNILGKVSAFIALVSLSSFVGLSAFGANAKPSQKPDELEESPSALEESVPAGLEAEPHLVDEGEQGEKVSDDGTSSSKDRSLTPQRGHWGLDVGIIVRSYYDSNIFIQPSHAQGDWVNQIAPSLHLGLGDYIGKAENYFGLDYTARASLYATHSEEDSLDHDVQLSGLKQFSRLDVRGAVQFKTATDPNIDAGNLSKSRMFRANVTLRYEVTAATAVESDTMVRKIDYTGSLLGSTEARFTEWYVYQLTARLDQSIGVTYGKLWVTEGASQTYEQVLSRTRLLESSFVTAALSLGVEDRQYEGTSKKKVNPVFALDLDYDSHAGRTLHLEAFRKTDSSSLFTDQNRIQTGLQASCRQHLAHNWSAAFDAEVEQVTYTSTSDTATGDRRDFVYALRPSIIYEPNEHWSVAPFLQFSRNDSNQDQFSFTDLQAGLVIKATF